MQRLLRSVCFAGFLLSAPSYATVIDPVVLLANYNLITSGNATTNGDIEGAMIIGGNFTGAAGTANLFNNSAHLPADKTSYIYGANSSQINVNSSGSLYIGGSNGGNINLNGGSNKLQIGGANSGNVNGSSGGVIAIAGANTGVVNANGSSLPGGNTTIVPSMAIIDVVSSLTDYSAMLAALPANGTIIAVANNSVTFEYAGSGQAVFNLTAAELTADLMNSNMIFLTDSAEAVVVNVDLQGADWTEPSSAHFASSVPLQNVLFNFYNGTGTTLSFTTMWETSILAMGSTVTNSTPIEGSVAAAAFVGHGELHNYPLETPPGGNNNPPPSVPEPATFAFLLAGLLGLFGLIRRKTAA
jgi:choice-of-anchor A domain-containing protein